MNFRIVFIFLLALNLAYGFLPDSDANTHSYTESREEEMVFVCVFFLISLIFGKSDHTTTHQRFLELLSKILETKICKMKTLSFVELSETKRNWKTSVVFVVLSS